MRHISFRILSQSQYLQNKQSKAGLAEIHSIWYSFHSSFILLLFRHEYRELDRIPADIWVKATVHTGHLRPPQSRHRETDAQPHVQTLGHSVISSYPLVRCTGNLHRHNESMERLLDQTEIELTTSQTCRQSSLRIFTKQPGISAPFLVLDNLFVINRLRPLIQFSVPFRPCLLAPAKNISCQTWSRVFHHCLMSVNCLSSLLD